MKNTLIYRNEQFYEKTFEKNKDFENFVYSNSKAIFGENTILLRIDRSLADVSITDLIPDAFLFEFDKDEIIRGKFVKIGFSRDPIGRTIKNTFKLHLNSFSKKRLLFPKLFSCLPDKIVLIGEFESKVKDKPLYDFIEKCVQRSYSVILVLDNEIPQLEYKDSTWGMWDTLYAKEYVNDCKESIIRVSKDYNKCTSIEELLKQL